MQPEPDYQDDYDYYSVESKLKNDFLGEYRYEYAESEAEYVEPEERKVAALTHLSAWLSIFGGFIVPISVLVPILVYFNYRDRSPFIAHHAVRALKMQVFMTLGAMVLLIVGAIAWSIGAVIAALSIVALVGLIALPVWVLIGVLGLAIVSLMPVAMPIVATIAALSVYKGRDYWYPQASDLWEKRKVVVTRLNDYRYR